MNTKQLLSLTLLATALTLNAALPKEYNLTYKEQANSVSLILASILYKRGIEKEKALEISQKFTGENEELFTLMLNNLLNSSQYKQEEVFERLSLMALQRKSIDLSSYAALTKLTQHLGSISTTEQEQYNLKLIADKNKALQKIFS
jgi:hypothetical protein